MSVYFPDTLLHRYTYTSNGTGVYGETVYEYEYADDVMADLQNEGNSEIAETYGVELQNLYKVYLDASTIINDTDQLWDDDGNKYHIIGNIQEYKKFHNYKKAHMVRER